MVVAGIHKPAQAYIGTEYRVVTSSSDDSVKLVRTRPTRVDMVHGSGLPKEAAC